MKILFDHQVFSNQKFGGISRYFCELYSQFLQMSDIKPELPVIYSENSYYQELFHPKQFIYNLHFKGKSTLITQMTDLYSKYRINKGNFDIFHPTYYNPYFLKFIHRKPYVLTVYDMIHELFPDIVCAGDLTSVYKNKTIESATKIIAISENTKNDIIKFYDTDPKKIEVIYPATSLHAVIPDSNLNLPHKYILFVGNRGSYKNFNFFISSVASILFNDKALYMVCAGSSPFSDTEMCLLNALKINRKVIHVIIDDDCTLSQLYNNATLFVFPSLYEGFGLPLLEAFSCGCPVAASNCSSLPEVGGDAVKYFDPSNSDSIKDVIEDIVNNKALQDSLKKKGYQRLKLFSWQKTAFCTKKVYDMLL